MSIGDPELAITDIREQDELEDRDHSRNFGATFALVEGIIHNEPEMTAMGASILGGFATGFIAVR